MGSSVLIGSVGMEVVGVSVSVEVCGVVFGVGCVLGVGLAHWGGGLAMSDNKAILRGYTRPVTAVSDRHTLFLWIKPDADLDDTFRAYDADECDWLDVNGWLFSVEDGHE